MITLITSYLYWHYTEALKDLWQHLKNFLWFVYHFFSIPVLFHTFFMPWRRMGESYPKGLDIAGFLSTFFINSLMRLVGVLMRFFLILMGLFCLFLTFSAGVVACVIWLALPWFAIILLFSGLRLLFL